MPDRELLSDDKKWGGYCGFDVHNLSGGYRNGMLFGCKIYPTSNSDDNVFCEV